MASSFAASVDLAWGQSSLFVVKSAPVMTRDASSRVGLTGDAPPLLALRQTSFGSGRRG